MATAKINSIILISDLLLMIAMFIDTAICSEHACPYEGQKCHVTEDGMSARCHCECHGTDCLIEGSVCASNGRTFESYRALAIWKCEARANDVELSYWSRCHGLLSATLLADIEAQRFLHRYVLFSLSSFMRRSKV